MTTKNIKPLAQALFGEYSMNITNTNARFGAAIVGRHRRPRIGAHRANEQSCHRSLRARKAALFWDEPLPGTPAAAVVARLVIGNLKIRLQTPCEALKAFIMP